MKERPRRVGEQIQRYLSSRLIQELRDPRLGFATITGVEMSPDLHTARVFVTVFGLDAKGKKTAIAALNGATGRLRWELGRDLKLRHVPSLLFLEDVSIERADRIERLIRDLHPEGTGPGSEERGGDEDDEETDAGHPEDAGGREDEERESDDPDGLDGTGDGETEAGAPEDAGGIAERKPRRPRDRGGSSGRAGRR
jgi:ribosome-binding factor A